MKWGIIILFYLVSSCMGLQNDKSSGFDKQGHRGCRSLMPENTIPAMIKAVEIGVNTLEMDVVVTKDHKVILSHEPFFNHEITTKPNGEFITENDEGAINIYQMKYEETRLYDVGLKKHPRFPLQKKVRVSKPLLIDVIDTVETFCRKNKILPVNYNIETKTLPATDNVYHPAPGKFIDLLMEVILVKGISDRVTIQSFDYRTLQYLKKNYPRIKVSILIDEGDGGSFTEHIKTLGFNPEIYSPHFSLVTESLVEKCHSMKIKVIPWTVNDSDKIDSLKKMGVDGIISDDPSLFNRPLE